MRYGFIRRRARRLRYPFPSNLMVCPVNIITTGTVRRRRPQEHSLPPGTNSIRHDAFTFHVRCYPRTHLVPRGIPRFAHRGTRTLNRAGIDPHQATWGRYRPDSQRHGVCTTTTDGRRELQSFEIRTNNAYEMKLQRRRGLYALARQLKYSAFVIRSVMLKEARR